MTGVKLGKKKEGTSPYRLRLFKPKAAPTRPTTFAWINVLITDGGSYINLAKKTSSGSSVLHYAQADARPPKPNTRDDTNNDNNIDRTHAICNL